MPRVLGPQGSLGGRFGFLVQSLRGCTLGRESEGIEVEVEMEVEIEVQD